MRDMDFERGMLRGRGWQHLKGQTFTGALCWMEDEEAPGCLLWTDEGDEVVAQSWRPSPAPWGVKS